MYQIRAFVTDALRYDNLEQDVLILNDQQLKIMNAVLTLFDADMDLEQVNGLEASRFNAAMSQTFDQFTEPYGFVLSCDYVAD